MSTKTNDVGLDTERPIDELPEEAGLRSLEAARDSEGDAEANAREVVADERRVPGRAASVLEGLTRAVPTLLVIGALAGLGYWGHHHGWKIPKFSELAGGNAEQGVAWCEEHGVPEAVCVACNAELMPNGKLHGWCK
ncbi:MAG: hypothetical protein ACC628_21630, partial [Pirellulaceae bacterium]